MGIRALSLQLSASAALLVLGLAPPAPAVDIDWVTVQSPGNLGDNQITNDGSSGYGAVSYVYRIGRTEVTNAQYAEFLNAVAATDTNALYHVDMGATEHGGIAQSGSTGSYSYGAIAGREQWPVSYVTFYDALRFANWMNNGQPTGPQGPATTDDGSYTITAQGIQDNSILRNPGARITLTSEDEWVKAAYHNAVGLAATDYYDYPAGTDAVMSCAFPPTTAPNSGNCYDGDGVVGLADVGSYTGSPSPWGTSDQGGNVFEWSEDYSLEVGGVGLFRVARGGAFENNPDPIRPDEQYLSSGHRDGLTPTRESGSLGFRLSMVPEPSTGLLVMAGLLGLARRRRPNA